ncbi:hypothetical protein BSKO_05659 [Bryopsis sp. KO-2023]|nr:hypothetical protein BSKO_05659 [Bryopsis sp. KO-2023]
MGFHESCVTLAREKIGMFRTDTLTLELDQSKMDRTNRILVFISNLQFFPGVGVGGGLIFGYMDQWSEPDALGSIAGVQVDGWEMYLKIQPPRKGKKCDVSFPKRPSAGQRRKKTSKLDKLPS